MAKPDSMRSVNIDDRIGTKLFKALKIINAS